MPHLRRLAPVLLACLGAACATPGRGGSPPPGAQAAPAPDYAEIVAAPGRLAEDRALDATRRPAELLAFLQVRPGMRVAELGAMTGYTSELLARAVGPTGTVFAQNSTTFNSLATP